ncbi:MAG: hypothetical protein WCK53_02230 [Methanomicrobiales archaeon]
MNRPGVVQAAGPGSSSPSTQSWAVYYVHFFQDGMACSRRSINRLATGKRLFPVPRTYHNQDNFVTSPGEDRSGG